MELEVQQLRWVLHKRGLSWNIRYFAVFLRFSKLWPSCMLRLSGIQPRCYGCRLFHHVVTAVAKITVELQLSEISPWCYSCGEFRCVSTVVANFAVLLRLCGIFAVLLRLSGILPVARAVRNFINTAMNGPRKSKPLFCRKCAPVATAAMCCTNSMQWS